MKRRGTCPACETAGISRFLEMPAVPVLVNYLYATREAAVGCPRGEIALGFCERCGFISNLAFDPSKLVYEEGYENPLHFSEVFNTYSHRLAADLVDRFDLKGKKLVEIGCGDGTFLGMLCEMGRNRGTGFDPSYPASLPTRREGFEVVRDFYSEKYAGLSADFFLSRHTLEHIHDPKPVLRALRKAMGDGTGGAVYIEVPNAFHTLRHFFVWDVIYEHPSYFTARSLSGVAAMCGLRVERIYEAFGGQYLCAEAVAADTDAHAGKKASPVRSGEAPCDSEDTAGNLAGLDETRGDIDRFAEGYRRYVERWKQRLEEFAKKGKRTTLWGVGSKGITFLNLTGGGEAMDCVVDLNPKKQGKFVAGSGHEIVAPSRLREVRPDAVIVANPVYRSEIEKALGEMELSPEIVAL